MRAAGICGTLQFRSAALRGVYRVAAPIVLVLAIAHERRAPDYWRKR
jgi:hypothetical protein